MEAISAFSGNKMAVGLDFPGFSWDAIGNVSDSIYFGSVKGQRKDFVLWQNYYFNNARESFFLFVGNTCS